MERQLSAHTVRKPANSPGFNFRESFSITTNLRFSCARILKLTEFGHRISQHIPVHAHTQVVRTNPLPGSVVHKDRVMMSSTLRAEEPPSLGAAYRPVN